MRARLRSGKRSFRDIGAPWGRMENGRPRLLRVCMTVPSRMNHRHVIAGAAFSAVLSQRGAIATSRCSTRLAQSETACIG